MTWQLNKLTSLHWLQWEGEWAVFDEGAGQTHQMNTLTAATLMTLESGPVSLSQLATEVAAELAIPIGEELDYALSGILKNLETAGLIEIASQ